MTDSDKIKSVSIPTQSDTTGADSEPAPGFKITELGPLPEEWRVVRLGEVVSFETGKREKGGAQSQGEIFSIGGEHITEEGGLDLSTPKFISRCFYEKMTKGKVRPGDTLVCKDGARTGKSAFVRKIPSSGLAVNEHVFIVRPLNARLYDEFLGFWFRCEQAWQQVRTAYHGIIGGLTREDVSNFLLPLPPLPEQRAIAHVLRTVQETQEVTGRVIAALKELKKSLMRHLFTYGPVPVGATERVPLRETEIGPIPEHWQVVKLGEVADMRQGKVLPMHKILGGPYPVFGANGQIGWNTEYTHANPEVLVTCRGSTCGSVNLSPPKAFITNNAMVVTPRNSGGLDKHFLAFALGWVDLSVAITGTGQPQITKATLCSCIIPLPPLPEQQEIARILQAVDDRIAAEERRREALAALFKSLLANLMTGRVRVPEEFVQRFQ